jgi:amino acid transporter
VAGGAEARRHGLIPPGWQIVRRLTDISMHSTETSSGENQSLALRLLSGKRPRDLGWLKSAGLLFGDWGTSRLYVLGLALFFAGRASFWLIVLMSGLILAVGWAYAQICRIYPDGGGVYTAAKNTSRTLAVVGALLVFADYTVTASLSVLDAFHYFGLPMHVHETVHEDRDEHFDGKVLVADEHYDTHPAVDAGDRMFVGRQEPPSAKERLWSFDSPGLWAIVAIGAIGLLNMLGPKHTGGAALAAAMGMIFITLLIAAFALPQISWSQIPARIGRPDFSHPGQLWAAFVSIVLALSGVEAIANLTGVMKRPVSVTASRAIWVVALEVAIFNIVLALVMLAIFPINRDRHMADMAAYLSGHYVGIWGELAVRIIGGILLLSAGNTAIAGMISIQYLMARDGELPAPLVQLNRFGVPWMPALIAAGVPILVLLISHNLDQLAALYAIGVIGAIAINISLCAFHPRLRKLRRKIPMMLLGVFLLAIWVTLAYVKRDALIFVTVVMIVGLSARQINKKLANRKGPRPTLLRQAIMEQLDTDDLQRPKILIGTYGSDALAHTAFAEAKRTGSILVVCFIRELRMDFGFTQLSMDSDLAALRTFARFLDLGHHYGVPVLPIYDSGQDAVELIAEAAAMTNTQRILIGSSRQGAIYNLIKGSFHQRLESLLPPEIPIEVMRIEDEAETIAQH